MKQWLYIYIEFKTKNTTTMKTAENILNQLGGSQFISMTGAKNIAGSENSIQFKVGRNAKKVTHVAIELNSMDTYTVKFYNCRKFDINIINELDNVYADQLQSIFTNNTGLLTSL